MQQWQGMTSPTGEICLKNLDWQCRAEGYFCRLSARQRYVNTSKTTIEAVYTFAMPHDAAVTGFALIAADGTRTTAVPKPKSEAQADYEDAVEKGDQPALLEMTEAGICTANIGSLLLEEEITLEISYVWALAVTNGRARITVPTVIGERYSSDGRQGNLLPHEQVANDFRAEYPVTAHFELLGACSAPAPMPCRDTRPR